MDLVDFDRPAAISSYQARGADPVYLHNWPVLHSRVMLELRQLSAATARAFY
jgi:hypothetical protein